MADSKISALPAATTPLAGTEELPLVQSGTTDKVSVANLTAGRAVSGLSFTVTGSSAPTNGLYLPAANTLGFAANSVDALRLGTVATGVNYIQITPGASGTGPSIQAAGTNGNLRISSLGNGLTQFFHNSFASVQFAVAAVGSAVNNLQVDGAATGSAPILSSTGSDTNIGMTLRSKGTGEIGFSINGWTQFAVQNVATAPDYPVAGGGSSQAYIGVGGSNTNVPLLLTSKGLGQVRLMTNTNNIVSFTADFAGSAVNYMSAIPAATGGTPSFTSAGSDTNIGAGLRTKGTGNIALQTNSNVTQLQINHTASAVNNLQITGGATGNGVTLSAAGTDTNIDVVVTPKGTGVVNINGTAASVSTATCDRTVPVKINGTTLYLMLSTTA